MQMSELLPSSFPNGPSILVAMLDSFPPRVLQNLVHGSSLLWIKVRHPQYESLRLRVEVWKLFSSHCSNRAPGSSSATTCDNAVNNSPQYSSLTCVINSVGSGPNIDSSLYKITCSGSVPSRLRCSKSGCSVSAPVIV